jgi:hypothetical protein
MIITIVTAVETSNLTYFVLLLKKKYDSRKFEYAGFQSQLENFVLPEILREVIRM